MKKPKLDKPAKEPKPPKEAKITAGSNTLDPQTRALFLNDKERYAKAVERQKKAAKEVREISKTIKEDGFSLRQIQLAIRLETPEGEAEFRSLVANDLLAAQYAGAQIGSQLQLFLEDVDRTPLSERAFNEGVQASLAAKSANPPYDPSTEAHSRWLDGYHSTTEKTIKAGIKPLDDGPPPRSSDMH
jgi:ribosome modulation factor